MITTAIDLFPGKDATVQTPGKLTWRFPKPFGIAGFVIDKLEMDKGGKFKLEVDTLVANLLCLSCSYCYLQGDRSRCIDIVSGGVLW